MEICESANEPNISYVVKIIGLLNEGAVSDEGGTYKNGDSRWRFKHSRTVCVLDCKEAQEAIAFVVAMGLENSIVIKEWPHSIESYDNWSRRLDDNNEWDRDERDSLICISPKEIKSSKLSMSGRR